MVNALDSGLGIVGLSLAGGTTLYCWARHCTLVVPLSNLMLGITL